MNPFLLPGICRGKGMEVNSGEHSGEEIGLVTPENDSLALLNENHQEIISYFVSQIFMGLIGQSWVWMALANIDASIS